MFTGIIEEVGKILSITEHSLEIKAESVLEKTKIGDSIAVNGVCLTVRELLGSNFIADVSEETLNITTLGSQKAGNLVNLERALSVDGRFGGHIVTGHIDGCAKIVRLNKYDKFYDLYIELSDEQLKYVVKKGSISVNGISLTVADIERNLIKIAIIPHTYNNTALKDIKIGDFVNIETDILSKYVEKFLSTRDNKTRIDLEFLQANGF